MIMNDRHPTAARPAPATVAQALVLHWRTGAESHVDASAGIGQISHSPWHCTPGICSPAMRQRAPDRRLHGRSRKAARAL
jgi:hypothetical protein